VRDYLEHLRSGWAAWGQHTHVIELSESLVRERSLTDQVQALQAAAANPSREALRVTLLVHFSGYGYHRRGLCQWLVHELLHFKQQLGYRARVVTMFHELSAFGPPWKSEFWLAGVQASIAGRMARLSDAIWTNSEYHADWLRKRAVPGTAIAVYPVFSNVGEPTQVPAFGSRARRLVIFGSAGTRSRAIRGLAGHGDRLRRLGIEEAVEVGGGQAVEWVLPDLPHRNLGRRSETELSRLMLDSAFALIDYPSIHLGKSGVFAAYGVHGCAVLNTCRPGPDADGLVEGRHYALLSRLPQADQEALSHLGPALRHWYAPHALARQTAALARTLDLAIPLETSHV
jgi:hypothetical protein